jgi:hypothetical protein
MKYPTFDKILFISAILLASCGAYYSIIGVTTLFSGAMVSVGIMAIALEIAKICSVTFLYRYWKKTQGFLKTYLGVAIVILMIITSCGIGALLSSAYQKSSLEFKATQDKIVMVESQKSLYTNIIARSESRIRTLSDARVIQESRLSEAMTNAFLSRNPLQLKQLQEQTISLINQANEDIKNESSQVQANQSKIMAIDEEIANMKFASANKKDIRTFQFVAEQFGTTLDKVAKWFILAIIFVFDPLAIALILAYNVVIYKTVEDSSALSINSVIYKEPQTINVTKSKETEIIDVVSNIQSGSISQPSDNLSNIKDSPSRPGWL